MFGNKLPPIHPGEMLREEFLKPLKITPATLARELHIPRSRISRLVNEETALTADTALRLAQFFGNSAQFWLNMQSAYEMKIAQSKAADIASIRQYQAAACVLTTADCRKS